MQWLAGRGIEKEETTMCRLRANSEGRVIYWGWSVDLPYANGRRK
jgi:hypothetical protein